MFRCLQFGRVPFPYISICKIKYLSFLVRFWCGTGRCHNTPLSLSTLTSLSTTRNGGHLRHHFWGIFRFLERMTWGGFENVQIMTARVFRTRADPRKLLTCATKISIATESFIFCHFWGADRCKFTDECLGYIHNILSLFTLYYRVYSSSGVFMHLQHTVYIWRSIVCYKALYACANEGADLAHCTWQTLTTHAPVVSLRPHSVIAQAVQVRNGHNTS
jgi:hypothetical protein